MVAAVVAAVVLPAVGTAMVYAPAQEESSPLALPPASETVVITAGSHDRAPLRPLVAGKAAAPLRPLVASRRDTCKAHATMAACHDSSPAGSAPSASR